MEMPGRVYLFCLFGEKGDDITRPYWIESKGIAAVVQTFELQAYYRNETSVNIALLFY